jgi:diadenosine tetraphosphate (Ap4A) HIT family hydrolase
MDQIHDLNCFICRKHAGREALPPGGYIYEDQYWKVCHAPADSGPPGTLLVEARRHYLDYAEMTPDEAASYGPLLHRLYEALKGTVNAERVYHIVLLEGQPHFHAWLVPRSEGQSKRGIAFLADEGQSCDESEAQQLVRTLRQTLSKTDE